MLGVVVCFFCCVFVVSCGCLSFVVVVRVVFFVVVVVVVRVGGVVIGLDKTGPQGWGPEGWGPEGWGGAPNFALFFSVSHHQFRSFCLSLCVFSWNFGGVLKRRGLKCARLQPERERQKE